MRVIVCSNCGAKNRVDESRQSEAKCGRCGEKLHAADARPAVITDQTFESEVLQARGQPVLVDCWAPWCGPCRAITPIMDQLAEESHGQYRITKLNVDENPQTAGRFQIASIPTMLIFKDGRLIDRIIGAHPKHEIAKRLQVATRSAA
jgi:thioredoxin 2